MVNYTSGSAENEAGALASRSLHHQSDTTTILKNAYDEIEVEVETGACCMHYVCMYVSRTRS